MRFKLALRTQQNRALLPFNYQYPLSAAIYKIIERADSEFALFLHDYGYTTGHKHFKLFTFSDVYTPFVRSGDRMMLTTNGAELMVCFYMPEAAENFIKGLFMHQQLEIADGKSKVVFTITGVEGLGDGMKIWGDGVMERLGDVRGGLGDGVIERWGDRVGVLLQPLSPLVAGRKNERGHYDYRSPEDADFADCLVYNWLEKWGAVHDASEKDMEELRKEVFIQVRLFKQPPQQRLIAIKAGTPAETKVRGYMKFRLAVQAPAALLELALGAGLGLHNAQGFGCVGLV